MQERPSEAPPAVERVPAEQTAPEIAPAAAPIEVPPKRRASGKWQWLGVAVAFVLAFVWGGIAYREMGPARTVARFIPSAVAGAAVKGAEAPPGWVTDFAGAFCTGDAKKLAARIGPPLTNNVEAISSALSDRDWSCDDIRYAGGGTNPKGTFFVYITTDGAKAQQWWVFTVVGDQVVAID